MSYAPCGVKSKNFHEPLDGNQYVWLHYRDVLPTLKAILKDPKIRGENYVYTFHVQYSTSDDSDRMYLQVFSTLHSKSFATTRGFASTGLSKVANGRNSLAQTKGAGNVSVSVYPSIGSCDVTYGRKNLPMYPYIVAAGCVSDDVRSEPGS